MSECSDCGWQGFSKASEYYVCPAHRAVEGRRPDRGGVDLSRIKLVLLDFDGVMTDNTAYVDEHGVESVRVHRGDGLGIGMLKRLGIGVTVISTETNPVVSRRCEKLKTPCTQSCEDKATAAVSAIRASSRVPWGTLTSEVLAVGNDVNDLAMADYGVFACPMDAEPEVLERADLVIPVRGGQGVVRWLAREISVSRSMAGASARQCSDQGDL